MSGRLDFPPFAVAASNSTYRGGTVVLSGGNNITVSVNGRTVSISAPAGATATGNLGAISASNSLYTSGTVVLTGGNNITVTYNGGTISISAPAGATATGNLGAISASNSLYTSGTVVLTGGNNVTVTYNGGTISISAANQSVQTQDVLSIGASNVGNTAGNTTVNTGSRFVFAGGNNITVSQGTAAGATTLTISAPNAQTGISGIANSETTYTSGTVSLSALGALTIRSTTGNQYQFSVNAQTNQAGTAYAAGNTFGTSSGTYDARTVSIAGDGIISVAASNSGFRISATQSVQTQNVHNLTLAGNSTSAGAGYIQVSSGTLTLAGGNNITLSQNGNAITISAGGGGAGMTAGLSNVGNTAGDTGAVTGRLIFAGGNNITLSGSTNAGSMTITISAPNLGAGAMSAGVSNLGNTAGSTGITGTQLVLVGSGVVSLSQSTGANGGTVSILAPATSSLAVTGDLSVSTNGSTISIGHAPAVTWNYWNPQDAYLQVVGHQGNASLHIQPAQAPNVQFDRLVIPYYFSGASNSTGTMSVSHWFGIYTRNAATLSLVSSTSWSTAFTHSGNNNSSLFNGVRLHTAEWTGTLLEEQYYVGIINRSSTGGANATMSQLLASQLNSNFSGIFGVNSAASAQYTRGLGVFSASTTAIPSSVALTDLRGSNSLVLRQPIFYLVSQTF